MDSDSDDARPLAARKPTPTKPAPVKEETDSDDEPIIRKRPAAATHAKPDSVKTEQGYKKTSAPQKPVGKQLAKVKSENAKGLSRLGSAKQKIDKHEGDVVKEARVKKEFSMPGQTRETPPENDPLRKFYASLREQRPDSELARKWCAMHGLLSKTEAIQYVEDVRTGKIGKARSTPVKSAVNGYNQAKKKPEAQKPASKRKALQYSDDDSDDFKPIAKRAAHVAKPKAAEPKPEPKPKPVQKAKPVKDVAIDNLGSDSDDDMPLINRKQ